MTTIGGYDVNTPAGQKALASSNGVGLDVGNNDASQSLRYLINDLYPTAVDQAAFANQLQPGMQNSLLQQIQAASPGNQWGNAEAIRAQAMAGASNQAAQTDAQLRASGAPIGAGQGAMVSADNAANSAANNYLANINSPQGIQNTWQTLGSLYSQGASQPLLQAILGSSGAIGQQMQINNQAQQQSFLDSPLGQLGGMVGQLGPSLLKGGAGGASPMAFTSYNGGTPNNPTAGNVPGGSQNMNPSGQVNPASHTIVGGVHFHFNTGTPSMGSPGNDPSTSPGSQPSLGSTPTLKSQIASPTSALSLGALTTPGFGAGGGGLGSGQTNIGGLGTGTGGNAGGLGG